MTLRRALLVPFMLAATGCWNSSNDVLHLGDVSLGRQLIDLKQALDANALSPDEYATAKDKLLATADLCRTGDDAATTGLGDDE